jgi:hypothetical protein
VAITCEAMDMGDLWRRVGRHRAMPRIHSRVALWQQSRAHAGPVRLDDLLQAHIWRFVSPQFRNRKSLQLLLKLLILSPQFRKRKSLQLLLKLLVLSPQFRKRKSLQLLLKLLVLSPQFRNRKSLQLLLKLL